MLLHLTHHTSHPDPAIDWSDARVYSRDRCLMQDICFLHCPEDMRKSMQILLERGAKVEEDRAAGGNATASAAASDSGTPFSGTTATTFPDFVPDSVAESVIGTDADAGKVGSVMGSATGSIAGRIEISKTPSDAVAVSSTSESRLSARSSSPRSKAFEVGAALARGEHIGKNGTRPITPRAVSSGSGSMSTVASDGTTAGTGARAGAGGVGSEGAVVVGRGEARCSPLRKAKQVS